jgi:hypothetical protein
LYDIDRLINRTLVDATLTALLGAVYASGVFVLGGLLNPVAGDSNLAELLAVVDMTMQPTTASLWLRPSAKAATPTTSTPTS